MMTVQRDMQVAASLESLRRALAVDARRSEAAGGAAGVPARRAPGRPGPAAEARAPTPATPAGADRGRRQHCPTSVDDPDRQYTEAVKSALIDAMLDHSLLDGPSGRRVADRRRARRATGRSRRNQLYELTTIVLRVKGSDLAVYAADRTRRAEVRQKVEVRVF